MMEQASKQQKCFCPHSWTQTSIGVDQSCEAALARCLVSVRTGVSSQK